MPFFKLANKLTRKPGAATNSPTTPMPAVDPVGQGAEDVGLDHAEQSNGIELARTKTEDIVYPTGFKLAALMASTFVSMFLVALVCLLAAFFHVPD